MYKRQVHILFEHKSYVESRIGLDLLRYRVRIWEQCLNAGHTGRLPPIIPVVVYHGAKAWRLSRRFADDVADVPALRECIPDCVYYLIDLSGYRDEELQGAVMLQTALLTLDVYKRQAPICSTSCPTCPTCSLPTVVLKCRKGPL